MNTPHLPCFAAVCLVVLLALTLDTVAQENVEPRSSSEEVATPKTAPAETPVSVDVKPVETTKPEPKALSSGVEEIVRMAEEGVSTEVLIRYVEASEAVVAPTAADVIAMKKRGVPDEVTVVVLTRSLAMRSGKEAGGERIAAPAIVRTLATDGQLDPESYEFFWYHYAYPRALAGSYQTLSPRTQRFGAPYSIGPKHHGPKWRTDGFPRSSFGPSNDGSVRRRP